MFFFNLYINYLCIVLIMGYPITNNNFLWNCKTMETFLRSYSLKLKNNNFPSTEKAVRQPLSFLKILAHMLGTFLDGAKVHNNIWQRNQNNI